MRWHVLQKEHGERRMRRGRNPHDIIWRLLFSKVQTFVIILQFLLKSIWNKSFGNKAVREHTKSHQSNGFSDFILSSVGRETFSRWKIEYLLHQIILSFTFLYNNNLLPDNAIWSDWCFTVFFSLKYYSKASIDLTWRETIASIARSCRVT